MVSRFFNSASRLVVMGFVMMICLALATNATLAQADNADGGVEERVVDAIVEQNTDPDDKDAETGLSSHVKTPGIDTAELEYRLVPLTKDELAALADEWLAIVKGKTEEVMAAQIAISRTDGEVETAAREKLTELTHERRALFDKYSKVISAWEKKGGDPDAIAGYRAYQNAIIVEETRQADFKTLLSQARAWLFAWDGGLKIGMNLLILAAAILALLFVSRVSRGVANRWIGHVPNLSKLLQAFLVAVIYWVVFAIGLMVVLSALGVDITPVFALIGGASFIMAFAFQDTLGNLASGMMIMINKPFDQGDFVDVGGVAGTVRAVNIFATTVATPDNQIIVIPNKNVWGNVITNVTASLTRRVDLVFGISYEDSIPLAARVIEETVKNHPLVLKDPEPVIRVHELADSSVNFVCRPWTMTSDYWTVFWDLTQQVKERFDENGISIPYPQQDVHIRRPAQVETKNE
ncbi:mechanosensitive ion channel family protein [Hoeflea sp. WL0058]|uniref:Small-conductance mechanosensitive channel n=1 Tax=Flavimaribacter sediminis TaxID=2865987 RepID=A0AAE2ZSA5_9HYPH|nr:mechanosensitive ion channel family protein [Flavimaribacter sediminis]MBW8639945.1 mechanosensitive ion channel family protein [Flavimaribacter sediminis]